ncbi:hypothetical protein HZA33_00405 [Candidatus Pacearchaeota archaeon]|nr:hypothetical protein [Candidatus Pacearchaeota archaeon]
MVKNRSGSSNESVHGPHEHQESEEKRVIEERKEKITGFFKKNNTVYFLIVLAVLLIILFVSIQIRTSNIPGLKDQSTGKLTLAPDLDPFLFLRWAKYIAENGKLMENDTMRYVPDGYNTAYEAKIIPGVIAYLYKFFHIFNKNTSVEYAAIVYPVIFFSLGIIVFFLFVRTSFKKYGKRADIIALIATAFLVIMQPMLHRTIAGIPEKEPMGFFFMFLAFYLFVLALQTESKKKAILFGALSGVSTGLLGLAWGGIALVFLSIGAGTLLLFLMRNFEEKDCLAYGSWLILFSIILSMFTLRYGGIMGLISLTSSAITYFTFAVLIVDLILRKKFSTKIKFPIAIVSLVLVIIIALVFMLIFNREQIVHIISDIKIGLLHPLGIDRITLTVAENNQPYFGTWKGTFGLSFFWIFVFASVLLFYEAISELKSIEKFFLTTIYFVFLVALIFSRYAGGHIMNGTSILSQWVYFGSFVIFLGSFAVVYLFGYKNKEIEKFKRINKESILILVLFFWAVVSARGAVRNFFLLAPIVSILVAFLPVDLFQKIQRNKGDLSKILLWVAFIFVVIMLMTTAYSYYKEVSREAKANIPSYYNVQWQYGMRWVRENTPKDAVFAHWWDYGYWVQTMGERATVLDGGNKMGYWDHLMGRHVLTGQNETEALEFLKTHTVSYLLIDSTEIGKYSAYSSIGSDINYDRYSWINTVAMDERLTQETRNETRYFYTGGITLDEGINWYDSARKQQVYLAPQSNSAGIYGFVLPIETVEIGGIKGTIMKQPKALAVYIENGRENRLEIPLKCVYNEVEHIKYEFSDPALPGCLYLIPRISQNGQSISINNMGAALYLSKRAVNALWVKLYLFNETTNFKLVHSEPNILVSSLNSQGANLPEIVLYGDIQGPIKIWKVEYPSNIKIKEEYLSTVYPKELYYSR